MTCENKMAQFTVNHIVTLYGMKAKLVYHLIVHHYWCHKPVTEPEFSGHEKNIIFKARFQVSEACVIDFDRSGFCALNISGVNLLQCGRSSNIIGTLCTKADSSTSST